MFGIGFFEILVIAVLGLLVFGPEKLPEAIRTFAFGFSKLKRSWQTTRRELEQELGMDEIRREIHNAQIMEEMKEIKSKAQDYIGKTEQSSESLAETLNETIAIAAKQEADDQFDDEPNTIAPEAAASKDQDPPS